MSVSDTAAARLLVIDVISPLFALRFHRARAQGGVLVELSSESSALLTSRGHLRSCGERRIDAYLGRRVPSAESDKRSAYVSTTSHEKNTKPSGYPVYQFVNQVH